MDIDLVVKIATIATPVIFGLGFLFTYMQIRSTRDARMSQVILSLSEEWHSEAMKRSRAAVNKNKDEIKQSLNKALDSGQRQVGQEIYDLTRVADFFDTLGLLVMEGYLRCRIAYDVLGEPEEYYYNIYKPVLEEQRTGKYYFYFKQLHKAFTNERACRLKTKPRSPS